MALRREKIVLEDLEIGTGTVNRTADDGSTIVGTKIDLGGWTRSGTTISNTNSGDVLHIIGQTVAHAYSDIQIKAYQASLEILNAAGTVNWSFAIDDADANKLKIGTGYSPQDGDVPAITIHPTGDYVSIGSAASPGGLFSVTSDDNYGDVDDLAWFLRDGGTQNVVRIQQFALVPKPTFAGMAAIGTEAAPTTLIADSILLDIEGYGYDGSSVDHGEYAVGWSACSSKIRIVATETWSSTAHGSQIEFHTTPPGTIACTKCLTITDDGNLEIGYGTTPRSEGVMLTINPLTSAGTRDSHALVCRGRSFDTSAHNIDWGFYVDVTSNAGASRWALLARRDADAYLHKLSIITDSTCVNTQLVVGDTTGTTDCSVAQGVVIAIGGVTAANNEVNASILRLQTTGGGGGSAAIISDVTGSGTLEDITFLFTSSEKMRLTTSGTLGIGTATPSTKAILDLTSTTQGFLPPRMTTTQRDAITSPATGLMIYNTTDSKINYYNGAGWETVGTGVGA